MGWINDAMDLGTGTDGRTFRGPGGHEGNEGTALPFSEQNRAGWVRGEGGVITWPGNPPPTLPVTGQTGSHEVRLDG